MNVKRFVVAIIGVFITILILDYVIHSLILLNTYKDLKGVWRPDFMSKTWIMYITALVFSVLFVYIFTKNYEGKGIGEGIRYGILIGLLMNVVGAFNQYASYPIPFTLALQWFIYGTIEFIVCGIVTTLIYKPNS
ncbi:MAG: hypothetical protein JW882_14235 [Deltaproteobacteria bacterium]|nr:hypothetical protein [Deltaproteobacteria bacterium]